MGAKTNTSAKTSTKASRTAEPDEGLVNAAAGGDTAAVRAVSDWYRERGLPAGDGLLEEGDEALAYQLEAWAFEAEEQHMRARKLRRLLDLLPRTAPPFAPTRRATRDDLRRHVSAYGLPVQVFGALRVAPRPGDTERSRFIWGEAVSDREAAGRYVVVCPTDGTREAETREAILAHLRQHFAPTNTFEVLVLNRPLTDAGEWGAGQLGLIE